MRFRWHLGVAAVLGTLVFAGGMGVLMRRSGAARPVFGRGETGRMSFAEGTRMVLGKPRAAFPLTVAAGSRLHLGFGVHNMAWVLGLREIDFVVSFHSGTEVVELMRRRLKREEVAVWQSSGAGRRGLEMMRRPNQERGTVWQESDVPLHAIAGQRGELRLDIEPVTGDVVNDEYVFWAPPAVRPVPSDQRPNILLFSIDTLRADHVGAYGYPRDTSPTLDRLAREGVLFRQAISSSSWTLPAHASMLTGFTPVRHGAVRFSAMSRITSTAQTVPERLWASGYATAGFTDGGFVSASFGFDRGFEVFMSGSTGQSKDSKNFLAENVARAREWLRATDGQPFFLFLHTYAVHLPYAPQPPYDRLFDPDYEGPCRDQLALGSVRTCLGEGAAEPRVLEHVKALYDGEIRQMDAVFDGFLQDLRSSGRLENTCVIVTSDHGEEFEEHGQLFHDRADLYEELIRVPLILWCPTRFPGGRAVDEPVSLTDVGPTILDLAGEPIPDTMEGASLLPTAERGATPLDVPAISEVDASIEKRAGVTVAVRTGRYKLVASSARDAPLLFDLRDDPGESRDVSATHPDVVAALTQGLRRTSLSPESAASATVQAKPRARATPDPAVLERLRALGYLP